MTTVSIPAQPSRVPGWADRPGPGPTPGPGPGPGPLEQARSRVDLRLVPVALAAWAGTGTGVLLPTWLRPALVVAVVLAVAVAVTVVAVLHPRRDRTPGLTGSVAGRLVRVAGSLSVLTVVVVGTAAGETGALAESVRTAGPVAALAAAGGSSRVEVVVATVPRPLGGAVAPGSVLAHVRVVRVRGTPVRGRPGASGAPVTVLADRDWSRLAPGTRVAVTLGFRPRRGVSGDAASAVVRGPPTVLARPTGVRAWAGRVRAGLARVSAPLGQPASGLLPAIVHGDTSGVPPEVAEQFRVSGLAHLQAVSGANVAFVVIAVTGAVILLGGGRRASAVLGCASVVGFAVLADLSPPVVRAGATAVLVLVGGRGGPGRGPALLCTAVTLLLLADPWLSVDLGFGLSVSATAGILVGAPRFAAALSGWLPGPVAAAVGVGLAAQAACQPLPVSLSGQVGLVAPFTNLAAEPAVALATLAGVLAAVLAAVSAPGPVGEGLGLAASVSAQVGGGACRWLALVARTGAAAPGAAADWAGTAVGVTGAVAVAALALVAGPAVLRHRRVAVTAAGVLLGLVLGPVVLG